MSPKPGRNDPCPCGSGTKYKFCCIGQDLRPRIVAIERNSSLQEIAATVDLTDDIMNHASGLERPLHHFCKDHNLYLFSSLTVGQIFQFNEKLKIGELSKADLFDAYIKVMKKDSVISLIDDACTHFLSFSSRQKILNDAVLAHYQGAFTLSVPVLFAQIEGILRDIGGLARKDDLKPTIKRDWDSRTLFSMTDSAAMFNAFLHKLYEGQQESDDLNRNPVLHGTDVGYDTHENSLILILTLLEIRIFLWFEKNTEPLF